ncbi:hypothetical protein ZHAS_00013681 [Anopheles sinensis]|uniref:Uncharacterized protein n=1 Tax=Anopheles sinensis TaxID=74873 RepID=A0A084W6H5_ANOSI|nr:hypothetical protein ZHAS_00013681 [Anopheles sinensis]
MNCRLFFVLLSVAVIAVKGTAGAGEDIWAKYALKPTLSTTPVKAPALQLQKKEQPQVKAAVPEGRSVPTTKSARNEPEVEVEEDVDETASEKKPIPTIILDGPPPKREIPIFAKMILGDPQRPKLATVEEMRKYDLRSVSMGLELPNKNTIPLTKELLEKSAQVLRLFQEIQEESNNFVLDIEKHNENSDKDYIGYYN